MRYIRFLKTPRIVQEKNNPSKAHIYALVTVASDLGDSFLPYDVTLSAELLSCNPAKEDLIVWRTIHWTGGMRSLPIILPLSRTRPVWPVRVRVGVEAKSARDDFARLYDADCRGVISAWSAPLDLPKGAKEAVKLVERRIAGCNGDVKIVRLWEETGESIARHLWYLEPMSMRGLHIEPCRRDAGVTMSCHIRNVLERANLASKKSLRVLELGTGCGIVSSSRYTCCQQS